MSTIASPRPSTSVRSPSSSRTSFDTTHAANPLNRTPTNPRRNRAALRDYYGLKTAASTDTKPSAEQEVGPDTDGDEERESELDKEGFNAEAYVKEILSTQGLQGVLKVEADLVSQIRNLDSDRKSLVYDNYSKLIAATDTIRRMRTNMDPLAPTTHTLSPAIAHIAETAASLSTSMHDRTIRPSPTVKVVQSDEARIRIAQKETVRWVLGTPRRLTELVAEEREEDAEKQWEEVRRILAQWGDVEGVEELREECEGILKWTDS